MMRLLVLLSLSLVLSVCRLSLSEEIPALSFPHSVQGDEKLYTVVLNEGLKNILKTYDSKTRKELSSYDVLGLTDSKRVGRVTLSRNGDRVFLDAEKEVEVFERVGEKWKALTTLPKPRQSSHFAVSSDGTTAWIGLEKKIEQYSVGVKSERVSKTEYHNDNYQMVSANDGKTAIVQAPLLSPFGTLMLTSKDGTMTAKSLGNFHVHDQIEISDDGKWIAFLTTLNGEDFLVVVMNTATRRVKYFPIEDRFGSVKMSHGFTMSRDGSRLAIGSNSNLAVIQIATGKTTLLKSPERRHLIMSFSKDGLSLLGSDYVIPLEK